MDRVDGRLIECRVECDPALVGMDLIPHVIAESLQPFDVDQSNHHATRNTGRSAHRGGQDSVLGAVASQIAGDFIGRGKCDPKVLVPDMLENPMVDPSSFLPGIDRAPSRLLGQRDDAAIRARDEYIGLEVLRVDCGGPGLAVERPDRLHLQDGIVS